MAAQSAFHARQTRQLAADNDSPPTLITARRPRGLASRQPRGLVKILTLIGSVRGGEIGGRPEWHILNI